MNIIKEIRLKKHISIMDAAKVIHIPIFIYWYCEKKYILTKDQYIKLCKFLEIL